VLNELTNAAMLFSFWVRIKAKVAVGVLDSCMQRSTVGAKAQAQQVTIVR